MSLATEAITPPFPYVEGVEHRFVDTGRLRMHVAEAGTGEPLLMLHGWPQHWYEWRFQIPPLAEHYRVICPDLRGFGWSDAPPDGYEKENMASDIVALLDALGLDEVRLVAHDWGGWIGFILCLRHPERFSRYLALNIPHPWGKFSLRSAASLWRFWYQYLIASPALGGWIIRNRPGFLRLILTAASKRKEAWSEEDIAAFTEPLREPARARATVQLYRTFLLREFVAVTRGRYRSMRLTTPTLLLFGTGDFAIPKSFLEGYEPYADDMSVELVERSGHFIAEDRPELVTQRALEFFESK
jgi:pimeloyl-ACP methyl ester carboxylesterase